MYEIYFWFDVTNQDAEYFRPWPGELVVILPGRIDYWIGCGAFSQLFLNIYSYNDI